MLKQTRWQQILQVRRGGLWEVILNPFAVGGQVIYLEMTWTHHSELQTLAFHDVMKFREPLPPRSKRSPLLFLHEIDIHDDWPYENTSGVPNSNVVPKFWFVRLKESSRDVLEEKQIQFAMSEIQCSN